MSRTDAHETGVFGRTVVACALAAAAVSLAVWTSPASAQRGCDAPPGQGAIEQYCETFPGPGGDRGNGDGGRPGGRGDDGATLPSDVTAQLEAHGDDGAGLLSFAEASDRSGERNAGPADRAVIAEEPSDSPLGAVGSAIEAGPTSARGFVAGMIAIAVALAAVAYLRRRST